MRELVVDAGVRAPGRRLLGIVAVLVLYAGLTVGMYRSVGGHPGEGSPSLVVTAPEAPPRRNVAVRDGQFYVDGAPFYIRAVGWDPARPGELPWTRRFDAAQVEADFQRMRAAGFNTVRTWAAMRPEELQLAERHGLRVLQGVWVPPDADFTSPDVRRQVLESVARDVGLARRSPAVLGYLILNEPRAHAVARAGLEATASFVREVAATVRALDPTAPVGFASWPGLEALDDDLLDFTAFNLYPHRPRVVMDEFGLPGYVRLLQRTVARGRPFLVSEYGLSVSPQADGAGRGGLSEEAQAQQLVLLGQQFAAAGVAGTTVFQWNDGWWKNDDAAGDERTHDPADPEEWFGLVAFEAVGERDGRARPALAALTAHHRALLLAPADGGVDPAAVPVRVVSAEPVVLSFRVDGGPPAPVRLERAGGDVWTGTLTLSPGSARQDVEFSLHTPEGALVRLERRLLRTEARQAELVLSPRTQEVRPGASFEVEVQARGDVDLRQVRLAAYSEARHVEERVRLRFGRDGRARVRLQAPREETVLTLIVFEEDPALPSAERAAALAAVEVRE